MSRPLAPDSDRLVALDAAVIAIVSLAICLWSDRLLLMTSLVPIVIAARLMAVAKLGVDLRAEALFLALCTVLGAFNDWNSVVGHQIYDYGVPHFFAFSTVPIWMLLFWGMILRFFARLARWERLGPPGRASNRVGVGAYAVESAVLRIVVLLVLTVVTRQTIYRFFLDVVWSWLPFALAIGCYLLFLFPTRHDLKLLGVFLVGGPAIEILYIQVGGMHHYHLGWIGGVPLWIILWWLLAIVIWKDFSLRIETALRDWLSGE